MTGGGIALVVAVFVIVMALVAGLNSAISDTGDPDNLIVLRKGATQLEQDLSASLQALDGEEYQKSECAAPVRQLIWQAVVLAALGAVAWALLAAWR